MARPQIRIVHSLRFQCSAMETFVGAADGKAAGGAPAASARTVGLDQLPVPSTIALAGAFPCLPAPHSRALLIRSADEDWGILRGANLHAQPLRSEPPHVFCPVRRASWRKDARHTPRKAATCVVHCALHMRHVAQLYGSFCPSAAANTGTSAGTWTGVQKPVPHTPAGNGQEFVKGKPFHPGYLRLELFILPMRAAVRERGADGARVVYADAEPQLKVGSWYNSTLLGAGLYNFTFGDGVPHSKLMIDLLNGAASIGTADGAPAWLHAVCIAPKCCGAEDPRRACAAMWSKRFYQAMVCLQGCLRRTRVWRRLTRRSVPRSSPPQRRCTPSACPAPPTATGTRTRWRSHRG